MDGTPERPRLVVSVGTSADGRVALNRQRILMDEPADRLSEAPDPPSVPAVETARKAELDRCYHYEAVLEGSGSFVIDDVGPAELPAVEGPTEELYVDFVPDVLVAHPPDHWFTVVDGRGRVRWNSKGSREWHLLVLVSSATPAAYLAFLRRENIPYLVVGDNRIDLAEALRRMSARFGVTCVVSQAGGGLNGALLRAGLVDEVHMLIAPRLVGGFGTPTAFDGPQLGVDESPTLLRLMFVRTETDGVVWLRYEVVGSPYKAELR